MARKWLAGVTGLVIAAVLVLAGLLGGGAYAAGGHHKPGCLQLTITFYIWGGHGSFTFDNIRATTGLTKTYNYCPSSPPTVSVYSLDPGYSFEQWSSNMGAFSSPTSNPTTFYYTRTAGFVVMYLRQDAANIWAGYTAAAGVSGAPTGTFTRVQTYLYLPSTMSAYDGDTNAETISAWVGIGGAGVDGFPSSNINLWQAGVLVTYTPGNFNPVTVEAFSYDWPYDYAPAVQHNFGGRLGDTIYIELNYAAGNQTGWGEVYDFNITSLGNPYLFTEYLHAPPDPTTATFMGEVPSCISGTTVYTCMYKPNFDHLWFFGTGTNILGLYGPTIQVWTQQTYRGVMQVLTASPVTTQGYFKVT